MSFAQVATSAGHAPSAYSRGHLPAPAVPLVGRELDLGRASALLLEPSTRLLTLIGPAGVGKTSLALELARSLRHAFSGGAWFVELSAVREAGAVLDTISRTLGLHERAGGSGLALEEYLSERGALLVLDNLEQIPNAAEPVAALLAAGPGVRVIATSRQALRLRAEQRYPVRPLALPAPADDLEELARTPSAALFLARAREADPSYALREDNAADIAALCARLDGLPLALELAASRVDALAPRAILAYLEAHGGVPAPGSADAPERHRSLQAALDWGFDLLDEPHKALFRRLGAFTGGFDAAGAEAVARTVDSSLDALTALAELADRSLIIPAPGQGGRFRMLATVRDYALERLAAAGELEEVRMRHAAFFLGLAEEMDARLNASEDAAAFDRFDLEYENMDEALRWLLSPPQSQASGLLALRLAVARWHSWDRRGLLNEQFRWLETALAQAGTSDLRVRVRGLINQAHAMTVQHDFRVAEARIEEAISLCRALGADDLRGWALVRLCELQTLRGDLESAKDVVRTMLEVAHAHDDALLLIAALGAAGKLVLTAGDNDGAVAYLEEGLGLATRERHTRWVAIFTWLFGSLAYIKGDTPQAVLYHERALEGFRETSDLKSAGFAAADLGEDLRALGEFERARPVLEEARTLLERAGLRVKLLDAVNSLGGLAIQQGRHRDAMNDLLRVARNTYAPREATDALHLLARLAAIRAEPNLGAALLGAADRIREAHDLPLRAPEQADRDAALELLRQALEPADLESGFAQGRASPLSALLEQVQRINFERAEAPAPPEPPATPAPPEAPKGEGLSARELEVLRLVTRGFSNKEISKELGVSTHTVKYHLTGVFNKLGCNTRAEAARLAVEQGLV